MNNEVEKKNLRDEIDWVATLVPLFGVVVLGNSLYDISRCQFSGS